MYSIKMQYKCVTFFMITHIFKYLLQNFFSKRMGQPREEIPDCPQLVCLIG